MGCVLTLPVPIQITVLNKDGQQHAKAARFRLDRPFLTYFLPENLVATLSAEPITTTEPSHSPS